MAEYAPYAAEIAAKEIDRINKLQSRVPVRLDTEVDDDGAQGNNATR